MMTRVSSTLFKQLLLIIQDIINLMGTESVCI